MSAQLAAGTVPVAILSQGIPRTSRELIPNSSSFLLNTALVLLLPKKNFLLKKSVYVQQINNHLCTSKVQNCGHK